MSVGFAHGVCNTDNFSLLSITIDYGPFGFMEAYNPDFVPNTSDDERRYKIGNQANVGMFNLNKLLQALNPLLDPRQKQLAAQILEGYPVLYYTRFRDLFKAKLGLLGERKGDDDLIAFLLHLMEKTEADFTMTFRQLSEITQSQLEELNIPQQFWALKMISEHKLFPAWVSQYLLRLKRRPWQHLTHGDSTGLFTSTLIMLLPQVPQRAHALKLWRRAPQASSLLVVTSYTFVRRYFAS